jgi:hypothetical protein
VAAEEGKRMKSVSKEERKESRAGNAREKCVESATVGSSNRAPTWSVLGGAVWIALGLIAAFACSTREGRIQEEQSLFESYPPEVQERIRDGKVALGDTEEMVRMTLGKPNETSLVSDEEGEFIQWAYTTSRPAIGVGIGGGNIGYGGGGVGGGVRVGSPARTDYRAIVEFQNGLVTRIRSFEN